MYFQKMAIAGIVSNSTSNMAYYAAQREEEEQRRYAVEFGKEPFEEGAMDPVVEDPPKAVEQQKSVICAFLRKWFWRD